MSIPEIKPITYTLAASTKGPLSGKTLTGGRESVRFMDGATVDVAIFPTELADTVSYVLEHSGASLLFVGKLDTWEQQKSGVPVSVPCIAFPLAPAGSGEAWDDIVARTAPLTGRVARDGADLCDEIAAGLEAEERTQPLAATWNALTARGDTLAGGTGS